MNIGNMWGGIMWVLVLLMGLVVLWVLCNNNHKDNGNGGDDNDNGDNGDGDIYLIMEDQDIL